MACLDTSLLIDLIGNKRQNRRRALAKIETLIANNEPLHTTLFNVAELYVGVERSKNPPAEEKVIQDLLRFVNVLEFDYRAARLFGHITAYLQVIGRPAGDMDVLIASVAIGADQRLITGNLKHFADIPGLKAEAY